MFYLPQFITYYRNDSYTLCEKEVELKGTVLIIVDDPQGP